MRLAMIVSSLVVAGVVLIAILGYLIDKTVERDDPK